MPSLNKSIVEDAALEWLGKQYRFARTFFQEENRRETIRRLNQSIRQSRTLATLRSRLLPKLLSGELGRRGSARALAIIIRLA